MSFAFTKHGLNGRAWQNQRFFEMIPGLTSWGILVGMVVLSWTKPVVAAVFIIAFLLYWLLKLIYMTFFLILSYYRLTIERKTDWMARIDGIDFLEAYLKNLRQKLPFSTLGKRLSLSIQKKELEALKKSGCPPPFSKDIYHLVIFPVIKEPAEIIELGVDSLSRQSFPINRMLVVFALEERAKEEIKKDVFALEKKYKNKFLEIMTVVHASDLPGEARVKGANVTFAAKVARKFFDEKNIPLEHVIVSCFDADTIVGTDYFSCLTYSFMVTPTRIQSSFQPIPVYHNNIWQVPGFARVIEAGSSFFQLIEATNPEKLVTFSSHSMSFKALVDVDYWPVDMISDDSAIYWKSFLHYDGQYRVVPMYVTVSMDIAAKDTFWRTMRSIYRQKRRWAWGVENFPIVMRGFLKTDKISLYDKIRYGFKLLEGHVSWATWGFLLIFISWLPLLLSNGEFSSSVLYYNTPRIAKTIFHLGLLSLLISMLISIWLLPKRNVRHRLFKEIGHALEWLLIPFILVFFSSLPSLDAQTRLLLGRYMEFWVSEKKRKN